MNEIIEAPKVTATGSIKVELFDDLTGKKIEEVNTHNFISQGVLRNLFNAKVNDVFTKGRATNPHEVSSLFNDPFAQISLTTANHPEDHLNEWLRAGKLIGYAHSDAVYSGADYLRGGYNSAESFTNQGHVRMVFDFPTNAANGEFRSIYFHPKADGHVRSVMYARSQLSDAYSLKIYNNLYYVLKYGRLEVYDGSWSLIKESNVLGDIAYDFDIVDDVIYYISYSTNNTIRKADLNNPSVLTNVISIPNSRCGGIIFDNKTNQFLIADYIDSDKKIRFYDKNFTQLGFLGIKNTNASYTSGQLNKQGNFLFCARECVDLEGNVMPIEFSGILGLSDSEIFLPGYIFPKTFIGSRCLLDAPITKEATQTMKITYDFKLPSIY